MVQLLRGNLLKPVFHSGDVFIHLRKLVSGYIDLVKAGTSLKNQRSALYRSFGEEVGDKVVGADTEKFVLTGIDSGISSNEMERERYEQEFKKLSKKHKTIDLLKSLPGIKDINAVKIAAIVVDARRFPTEGHFWVYCGLMKQDRISGGRSYGKKTPRYCRTLKDVFKSAAATCIQQDKNNAMREYYLYLLNEKKLADFQARTAVARRLATLAWAILRSGKKFDPNRRRKCSLTGL